MSDNEYDSDTESSSSESSSKHVSNYSAPSPEELATYNQLMSTIISTDLIQPQHNLDAVEADEDDDRPMTKAEKQNAKKKRRKERERQMRLEESGGMKEADNKEEDELVPFRLFSSCPITKVSLLPAKEDYPVPMNPRLVPLSPRTTEKIHLVAASSAVHLKLNNTLGESGPSGRPLRQIHLLDRDISLPDICIATIYPDPSRNPENDSLNVHNPSQIPTLSFSDSVLPLDPKRKRKRRVREPHPPPRFWAPEPGIGGKARGYGWGWRGSMEGRREGGGYVRSKGR